MRKILSAFAALLAITACYNSNQQKAETAATTDGKAIVENIMTRTSIRQYTDQDISADTIETLLRAGMAAPTAVNKQPWHFVAITSKDKMKELAATNPNARMLEQAPLTIVVCGDMKKALEGEGRQLWIQDCSAATENLLLAATAMDLGAVWLSCYPNEKSVERVSKYLGLPANVVPLEIVPVGIPAENPEPKAKWNADNIHYEKW